MSLYMDVLIKVRELHPFHYSYDNNWCKVSYEEFVQIISSIISYCIENPQYDIVYDLDESLNVINNDSEIRDAYFVISSKSPFLKFSVEEYIGFLPNMRRKYKVEVLQSEIDKCKNIKMDINNKLTDNERCWLALKGIVL